MGDPREHVRFDRIAAVGVVTLDRQEALNALTHDMVRRMSRQLAAWHEDPAVAAVLVKAVEGRAFCAGGDVRSVIETCRRRGVAAAAPFFRDEYRLNWRIKHFRKPYVAFLDGVTMGGGVGISVHGSHRIVTERTLFAMPETGIGFFPDVGGTFFLPRCPGEIGMHLALTGARLDAADCLHAGIGTHFVPSGRLLELEARLLAAPADRLPAVLDEALARLAARPEGGELAQRRATIDACYGAPAVERVVEALAAEPTGWGEAQRRVIESRSPFATKVTFRQLRRGRGLDFAACMRLEYRMVHRMLESGEFAEGVRALLVDKDKRPRWRHPDLASVREEEVEAVFAPLPEGDLPLDWHGV